MELTPAQAEKEWKSGKLRPAYYLVGEDASAKDAALKTVQAVLKPDPFNMDVYAGDSGASAAAAVAAALAPPMMSDRRLVVVKNPRLGVEARKALAEYLREPLQTTTLLAFSEDRKPDFRDVLTAAVAALGGVVVFKPLRADEAVRRLVDAARRAGREMAGDVAEWIVDEAGTSWAVLQAELEKMILFTRGRKMVTREDALACLGYRQTANPFDFPRALQMRDRSRCLILLRRLLADGEEPLRLLYQVTGALNKQLKAKRLCDAGTPEEQIFRELRLQSYYDRDFLQHVSRLSEASLRVGLKACLRLDTALKSETWLDGKIELERLVEAICDPAARAPGENRATRITP